MFKRMTRGEKCFQVFNYVFLTILTISMLLPFVHVVSVSFSSSHAINSLGFRLYPLDFTLDSYIKTLSNSDLWVGFGNSVFRTVTGTVLALVFMSMGAYALSKTYMLFRNWILVYVLISMFFSGGLIPYYFLIRNIGLIDSRWVLVIPILYSAFSVILIRNFFASLPAELEDSARVDGANDFRILFSVVMPTSKPVLATIGLWTAVGHWNAWFDGLIFIRSESKMILQIYLRRIVIESEQNLMMKLLDPTLSSTINSETIKSAVLIVTMIPILLVYPFLQKHFAKGIMIGSLKG